MDFPALPCRKCFRMGVDFQVKEVLELENNGTIYLWHEGHYVCPACGERERHCRYIGEKEKEKETANDD